MKYLILDADVVISGYRPHVLDEWGFGQEGMMKICGERDRGVIYVRENCYDWNGPRSGWQQISDAVCSFLPNDCILLISGRIVVSQWNLAKQWATTNQ